MVRCAYIRLAQHRSMSQRRRAMKQLCRRCWLRGADKDLQKKVLFVAAADHDNALNAVNSAALAVI